MLFQLSYERQHKQRKHGSFNGYSPSKFTAILRLTGKSRRWSLNSKVFGDSSSFRLFDQPMLFSRQRRFAADAAQKSRHNRPSSTSSDGVLPVRVFSPGSRSRNRFLLFPHHHRIRRRHRRRWLRIRGDIVLDDRRFK